MLNSPFNSRLNSPFNSRLNSPFNSRLNSPFNSRINSPLTPYYYQINEPFMGSYYCLMAGAPDITLDTKQQLTVMEFKEQLEDVISEADQKLLYFFYLQYDCKNLVRLLKNSSSEIDPRGNLNVEQLNDLITHAQELNFNVHRYPAFMSVFAREYNYNKEKDGWFAEDAILLEYYTYAQTIKNKMMRLWYSMNLNLGNILTALIAKKYGWNVGDYIVGDNEVNEMIRTNRTADFGLGNELDYMPQLMKIVSTTDPVQKEHEIDAFKWTWLDDATFFDPFSIEAVFAYIVKLDMLERWAVLDVDEGKKTFRSIIENLRKSAQVPDEFQRKDYTKRNK